MKFKGLSPSAPRPKIARARSASGVALLIVLALLVLLTGLVMAFFTSATTELASAKSYASGTSSQQLADAATQLAIGSIRKATSETSASSASGTDIAWASQPGMIRTWDSRGDASKVYKLFSAYNSEAVPPYDPTSPTDGPDLDAGFDKKPALFTDLNAPVTDPAGTRNYPIVDPTLAVSKTSGDVPKIAGFYLTDAPAAAKVPNAAPMPVRWLYVLQDGKLLVPDPAGDGLTAEFTGAVKPTLTNPIVGRVAYWTDDDTSKVNINTASEGVYWDMPRLMSQEDTGIWNGSGPSVITPGLALTQPASGEYQRYPGHPATTSLSPILGNQVSALAVPDPRTALTTNNVAKFRTYYDLLPRISKGGSESGTVIPNPNPTASTPTPGAGSIVTDNDRLFASVDEFMFMQPTVNSNARQVLPAIDPTELKPALERSRFFLTAHSSAPEVTMFNTPRVSMWPVWNDASKRTVLDSTLAFCANLKVGLGGLPTDTPYYFTRQNSRSMTADYALSPRNQQLYAYLDRMMKTSVPGFGGKFDDATSLGADQPQVLTSIYDYIRCINLYDASLNAKPYTKLIRMNGSQNQTSWGGGEILPIKINNTQGFGRYATLSGLDLIFCAGGQPVAPAYKVTTAQVMLVPTFFSPMQGLPGMYPKIKYSITALEGTFTLDGQPIFQANGGITGTNWITNAPVQQTEGRGMGGMISPRASLERYGEFSVPYFYKQFAHGASNPPNDPPSNYFDSGAYPFVSYNTNASSANKGSPNLDLGPPDPSFPTLAAPMRFTGGKLTVTISSADVPSEIIQTFTVVIPDDATIARPNFNPSSPTAHDNKPFLFNSGTSSPRETGSSGSTPSQVLAVDSVRGVEVAGPGDDPADTASTNTSAGDVRMVAALPTVPSTYFHAHKDWSASAQASGLMDDDGVNRNFVINSSLPPIGAPNFAGKHGALAKGMNPRGQVLPAYGRRNPYVPSRALSSALSGVTRTNGDSSALGDWDTGFALLPDGAYLNMGDIGDQEYVDEVNNLYSDDRGKPRYPYVVKEDHFSTNSNAASTYFSPNRQVPSSMVLGSIPTGVKRFQPWQTLLFNPKPEDANHPGRGVRGVTPPDHLLADLFWMPVVLPYPISQPFSTAGKINLNYQIEPFTYIERSTGIYALMKATKMMAIPTTIYPNGQTTFNDPKPFLGSVSELNGYAKLTGTYRFPINVKETLTGFEKVFATNDIFRSASQISEINLVPDNGSATYNSMAAFWQNNPLTGDNLREKPYVDLYPRLTTKSNSYTVHFRVQVLQKLPNTPVDKWVEGRDQVGSEYRGSSEIERYLDSGGSKLPDYAALMASNPGNAELNLNKYYRYRIVSTKRFSPY